VRLEEVRVPGEAAAEERAWSVLSAAYEERRPAPRERRLWRPVLVLAAVAVVAGVVASPPGRAVLGDLREAVGVKKAAPALFSLPTSGRLLVVSAEGPWVVQADGSKRLLGEYGDASWSPHSLYVSATRQNELLALDPKGDVRWSLARPAVCCSRWAGTLANTRIAYVTTSRLHVVAGDGTKDVDAGGLPAAARVAPAWRPGLPFVLAYADTLGRVSAYEPETGALRWRSVRFPRPRVLEWSSDGKLVLVVANDKVAVLRGGNPVSTRVGRVVAAAFRPGTHEVAEVRARARSSEVVLRGRVLFHGAGEFRDLSWSPNGRWLLVSWPTANQWVFLRVGPRPRLVAVSNVSQQFGSFPRIAGWCCAH
jgi:hypothetical protein